MKKNEIIRTKNAMTTRKVKGFLLLTSLAATLTVTPAAGAKTAAGGTRRQARASRHKVSPDLMKRARQAKTLRGSERVLPHIAGIMMSDVIMMGDSTRATSTPANDGETAQKR